MESTFKLSNYVKWTGKTCAKLSTHKDDVTHMLFGMTTEVGELIDVFKKDLAYNKEIDWVNVEEEIGDLMFYIASFCRMNNLDLEDIILSNVTKLETRYAEKKFSEEEAKNRNLEKERKALEK
jgi:NTP pyrophosphatase (non-canonical NTP hydrolase)